MILPEYVTLVAMYNEVYVELEMVGKNGEKLMFSQDDFKTYQIEDLGKRTSDTINSGIGHVGLSEDGWIWWRNYP